MCFRALTSHLKYTKSFPLSIPFVRTLRILRLSQKNKEEGGGRKVFFVPRRDNRTPGRPHTSPGGSRLYVVVGRKVPPSLSPPKKSFFLCLSLIFLRRRRLRRLRRPNGTWRGGGDFLAPQAAEAEALL